MNESEMYELIYSWAANEEKIWDVLELSDDEHDFEIDMNPFSKFGNINVTFHIPKKKNYIKSFCKLDLTDQVVEILKPELTEEFSLLNEEICKLCLQGSCYFEMDLESEKKYLMVWTRVYYSNCDAAIWFQTIQTLANTGKMLKFLISRETE